MDILRLHLWEDQGLTLPQLRVLLVLRAHPGTATHELSSKLGVTMSTISGLVDKLVRAGLVERCQDPDDRRVVPLRLTEQGEALVGEVRQINQTYLESLISLLGPEDVERATPLLERLAEAADSALLQTYPEREAAAR